MFCNVDFSNLENFLQRKQKTGRTRECIRIFRASGGANFETFSRCGFDYLYKRWVIEYSNV